MAISDSAKIDLLYKKLFGVSKSDTSTAKSLANEATASYSMLRSDKLWAQSGSIPATPPSSTTSIVQVYTGTASKKCTGDTTTSVVNSSYVTWLTGLTDWVTPEFGSQYFVKVYADSASNTNPQSTGTQLDANASGAEWWFDYQAGTLHFIGGTPPASLSGKVVWVVGYRYVGTFGLSASALLGTLPVTSGGTGVTTNTGSGSNVQATQPTFKDWIVIDTSGSGYNTYIGLKNSIGDYSYIVPNSSAVAINNYFLPATGGTLIGSSDSGTVSDTMLTSGVTSTGAASKIVKTTNSGNIVAAGNITAGASVTASGVVLGATLYAVNYLSLQTAGSVNASTLQSNPASTGENSGTGVTNTYYLPNDVGGTLLSTGNIKNTPSSAYGEINTGYSGYTPYQIMAKTSDGKTWLQALAVGPSIGAGAYIYMGRPSSSNLNAKLWRYGNEYDHNTSWTTNGAALEFSTSTVTDTVSTAGTTVTARVMSSFGIPTFASTNAVAITNAATVYIAGGPASASPTSITNSYALLINSGASKFGGNVSVDTLTIPTLTTAGVVTNSSSGAVSNVTTTTQYNVLTAGAGGTPTWGAINLNNSNAVSNQLQASNGGTGFASYLVGDLLYASGVNTLSRLVGNTTTTRKFLSQTGDGTNSAAPSWLQVTANDVGLGTGASVQFTSVTGTSQSTFDSVSIGSRGVIGTVILGAAPAASAFDATGNITILGAGVAAAATGSTAISRYSTLVGAGANSGSATVGFGSTVLGFNSGYSSTGNGNMFIGAQAGTTVTTGSNNIIISNQYANGTTPGLTTGSGNVILGNLGTGSVSSSSSNTIYLADGGGTLRIKADSTGVTLPNLTTAGVVTNTAAGLLGTTATTGTGNVVLSSSPTLSGVSPGAITGTAVTKADTATVTGKLLTAPTTNYGPSTGVDTFSRTSATATATTATNGLVALTTFTATDSFTMSKVIVNVTNTPGYGSGATVQFSLWSYDGVSTFTPKGTGVSTSGSSPLAAGLNQITLTALSGADLNLVAGQMYAIGRIQFPTFSVGPTYTGMTSVPVNIAGSTSNSITLYPVIGVSGPTTYTTPGINSTSQTITGSLTGLANPTWYRVI